MKMYTNAAMQKGIEWNHSGSINFTLRLQDRDMSWLLVSLQNNIKIIKKSLSVMTTFQRKGKASPIPLCEDSCEKVNL